MKTETFLVRLLKLPFRLIDALLIGTFKLTYLIIFLKPHKDPPVEKIVKGEHFGPSRQERFLAKKLDEWKIPYVAQYRNGKKWGRRFSIDIYVPKYKVGIEVNGSFKYKDGVISPYYKKRADIIFNTSGIVIVDMIFTDVKKISKKDFIKLLKDNSPL